MEIILIDSIHLRPCVFSCDSSGLDAIHDLLHIGNHALDRSLVPEKVLLWPILRPIKILCLRLNLRRRKRLLPLLRRFEVARQNLEDFPRVNPCNGRKILILYGLLHEVDIVRLLLRRKPLRRLHLLLSHVQYLSNVLPREFASIKRLKHLRKIFCSLLLHSRNHGI